MEKNEQNNEPFSVLQELILTTLRRAKIPMEITKLVQVLSTKKRKVEKELHNLEKKGLIYYPEKKRVGLLGDYHGVQLLKNDALALIAQEELMGKEIPLIKDADMKFGYVKSGFRIQQLGLFNLGLKEVHEDIGNLSQLQLLDLGYNQLTDLPETFSALVSIEQLNLAWNQFKSFPWMLRKIVGIKRLEFQGNKLHKIPDWISKLYFLEDFDLGHNELTKISFQFGELENLKKLSFWNNQLSSIPTSIAKLPRLEHLDFSKNKLTSVPEELGRMTTLRILNLEENLLETLPKSFSNLPLQEFKLKYNHIHEVEKHPVVRQLRTKGCKLTYDIFIGEKEEIVEQLSPQ